MADIIDGRITREALLPDLITRIKGLSFVPQLTIIQVGNREDSSAYIRGKISFAAKIGVQIELINVSESVSQYELIDLIQKNNEDRSVQGMLVQLPLPISLDQDVVLNSIDPKKDVDGLTSLNVQRWNEGREDAIFPATARGVRELLSFNKITLDTKKVVVVGRSELVGKPIAAMCLNENAEVTVCHSKTPDLAAETKNADILIVAVGKAKLIGTDHVKAGQVIVDVGINSVEDGTDDGKLLVGDVDFDAVKDVVAAITPVPGGVGPMTVFALFENLIDLCSN